MHDRHRRRRRRRRLALLVLLVLLAVWLHRCTRPTLVVGTFNIRLFKAETTDPAAVADAIAALDADLFAVQEIVDLREFDRVLARAGEATHRTYRAAFGRKSRVGHTGVVYDAKLLTLERHEAFPDDKHAPRGVTATLRGPDDRRLTLLAVHLKAGSSPADLETRDREWAWLTAEIRRLRAADDAPVLVAGDFNTTDWLTDGPERRRLDGLLDDLDARVPTATLPCSMYWQPRKDEPRHEPSLLDHVLVPEDMSSGTPEVLGMCAALACAPHDGAPHGFHAVSDHCPVRVRVR